MSSTTQNLTVIADVGDSPAQPDVDDPYTPHESHEWCQFARWAECSTCGVRDYWPGAVVECTRVKRADRKQPHAVTLAEALERLAADLEAFGVWWTARAEGEHGLGLERPTLNEWAGEFAEWRRVGTANY